MKHQSYKKRKLFKIIGLSFFFAVLLFELYLWNTKRLYVNKTLANTIFKGRLGPDIDELKWYPYNTISPPNQTWHWGQKYTKSSLSDSTIQLFNMYETEAFVAIQADTIIYEYYRAGYDTFSMANSFSMAKSFTAMLIGCAIRDGLIASVADPIGKYIPELSNDARGAITIEQLLTMSSGIAFDETYSSPFAWPSAAYYGPNVKALTLNSELSYKPGTIWSYKGGDTQLLGIILSNVTGKSISEYASDKLWKPMGASHAAYWSTDEQGMEKVSCCYYSHARDFARFARLMMHHGNWNGLQLIDSSYVEHSIKPASHLIDDEGNSLTKYGYQWWLMQHAGHEIFYARGIRGQYVFAIPDKQMIVVRIGHKRAPKSGHAIPADIYVYLNAAMELAN
jgi:CubicO group peptidase (beta-lactamase class C family)